ncbi:hypothetical protein HGP28_16010 [Vibrio sp. SM6]|uniref:Uncharacterized protein n=1 Tax=Vibrio agarilyticus TaxID=2726741 RepID=A0A7X8TT92_9VIBR|nr:hypothetical protein [Vibrio agarilyticus]NLS14385.1 hypothetical protein [Vibrio agarilyticus]
MMRAGIKDNFLFFVPLIWQKRVFRAIVLIGVLGIIIVPVNFGLANVFSQLVAYKHERWLGEYNVNSKPDLEDIKGVTTLVEWMRALDEQHPHYLSLASSHYVWLSIFNPVEKRFYLELAYELELKSVQRRPTWFMSYVNLAKIGYFIGRNPEQWLIYAERYGPHSIEVKSTYVSIVFEHWLTADSNLKAGATRSLFSLIRFQPSLATRIISDLSNDAKDRACRLVTMTQIILPGCNT